MNKKSCMIEFRDEYRRLHPETCVLPPDQMPSWAKASPEAGAVWRERRRLYTRKYHRENVGKLRDYYARNRERILIRQTDYSRRNLLGTYIDGKYVALRVNKRRRPESCELCGRQSPSATRGRKGMLYYHHWDDDNPSMGMWLCLHCHIFAGIADKEMYVMNYLQLKEQIEISSKEVQYGCTW